MMTFADMIELVSSCEYKPGWTIHIHRDHPSQVVGGLLGDRRVYIQLEVKGGIDTVTRQPTDWKSGKRYLSPHMCRQEVVGAVFGLIKDTEMHEIHEWFRYRGRSIFNPHLDPDVLAEVASKASSFNCREDAMSMVEGQSDAPPA